MANDIPDLDGSALIREVRERLNFAYMHDQDNRLDAVRDFKFLAGDQWPANVRLERERHERPVLTLNRLPQFVNQVVNDFKQNPPTIKVTPTDQGSDPDIAELYNGILSEIHYRSNATSVFGTAFGHSVSCGIGHFRIETGYVDDDSFDQEIKVRRITQPLSVYWDPDAVEPDRADANWCVVTDLITEKRFKELYPGKSVDGLDVPNNDYLGESYLYWRANDNIRIAEYWCKVPVTKRIALLETGDTVDITDIKKSDLQFLPKIVREREVESHEVRQWLISGADILDGGTEGNLWAGKYIPIIPVIGSEVPLEDKIVRYGLIRWARDPQQLYNYWRSCAAETIALAPKAPFLATPTMIGEFKGQWDSHNVTTRPYLLYKPDPNAPGGMPKRAEPVPIPAALVQEASISADEMKATTGIYDASMGNRSNETSGRAIVARDRQGDVGTYGYMDNFNASLTHAGRIIVDLIPKIYDSERTVKLYSEEHETPKFATINQAQLTAQGETMVHNDLSQGKFDVRVKLGPSYATRRLESADSMLKFIQAVPQAAQVMGDLIAKAMDWEGSEKIAERLQRMIPPNILGDDAPEPTPQQQQAMQEQQAKQQQIEQFQQAMAQTELQNKQAQAQKTGAEAQLKAADAVLRQAEGTIAQIHAWMQQHGINVNQPSNGYPNPNGYDSASQGPSGPSQHQQTNQDYQSSLDSAIKEETLRKNSALADQAAARTQGAILDNRLKQAKVGQDRFPLGS